MKNKIYVGNCLKVMKKFKKNSVNCVVTSPPYFGLRSYGTIPQIYGGDLNHDHKWIQYKQRAKSGGKKSDKVKIKGRTLSWTIKLLAIETILLIVWLFL